MKIPKKAVSDDINTRMRMLTTRTDTLYSSTSNQDVHRRCQATDQRADFEEDNASHVNPFVGGNGENLSECKHQAGLSEEVCRDDPGELLQLKNVSEKAKSEQTSCTYRLELGSQFRECSGHDSLVECHQ